MGKLNLANMKKTVYFLKRNGVKRTFYAVLERLEERKQPPYTWEPLSAQELEEQRRTVEAWRLSVSENEAEVQKKPPTAEAWEAEEQYPVADAGQGALLPTFSILVPTYCTAEPFLREMIDSLLNQTYPCWELILADATPGNEVEQVVQTYTDSRIRYTRLAKNAGISENTNQALALAVGDYVGLLDHDDVLTPDALFEMAGRIREEKKAGRELQMLYSDEDKCNGDATEYYEPNFKPDFNLDLLLSNNYICHFLVMKRELIQGLGFRSEYEGAQDFDLVLRGAAALKDRFELIAHVPKVLYHWRCHTGSTAENPRSKLYAYEAGKRAIQDFADRAGWKAKAVDTLHVGFYNLEYEDSVFEQRPEVGACGGNVVKKGRIVSGLLDGAGGAIYENLPLHYSGYLHRAKLPRNAEAVDIRNISVRPECYEIFEKITGVAYKALPGTEVFDISLLPSNCNYSELSLKLCEALKNAGYEVLYLPDMPVKKEA